MPFSLSLEEEHGKKASKLCRIDVLGLLIFNFREPSGVYISILLQRFLTFVFFSSR
jgi:hypothetical protein